MHYDVGRPAMLLAAAASIVLATAGAAPSDAGPARFMPASTGRGTLVIVNETGGNWTCGFNPFNLSGAPESVGVVYEPLAFVNTLKNGRATPWLARSWSWSAGNTVLTFTIRNGVRFSDGRPLTAADVAYTFNLMKRHPSLDINGVWSALSDVTARGSGTVVMTFKSPAVPYFYYIADQVGIVPKRRSGRRSRTQSGTRTLTRSAPARSRSAAAPRRTLRTRRALVTGSQACPGSAPSTTRRS
jgi:peptide/nickel transport system substrate-binding protein